ncbi:MAG: hypothetical protein AAF658_19470, partial [Myxococcota bacterium]
ESFYAGPNYGDYLAGQDRFLGMCQEIVRHVAALPPQGPEARALERLHDALARHEDADIRQRVAEDREKLARTRSGSELDCIEILRRLEEQPARITSLFVDASSPPDPMDEWSELRPRLLRDPATYAESASRLAGALLNEGHPHRLKDATQRWTACVEILSVLKGVDGPPDRFRLLTEAMVSALPRKGRLNEGAIEKAYRAYFGVEALPKRCFAPKNLLAYIALDFQLGQQRLPQAFGERIRTKKRGPSFHTVMPLVRELGRSDPVFIQTLRDFEAWGEPIVGIDSRRHYWGAVEKLVFTAALDRKGFMELGVWDSVCQRLRLSEEDRALEPRLRTKHVQRQVARVREDAPNAVSALFDIRLDGKAKWRDPTEKELNAVFYLARVFEPDDLPRELLKPYFEARLNGGDRRQAIDAYHEAYRTRMRSELAPLEEHGFLAADG